MTLLSEYGCLVASSVILQDRSRHFFLLTLFRPGFFEPSLTGKGASEAPPPPSPLWLQNRERRGKGLLRPAPTSKMCKFKTIKAITTKLDDFS